MGVSPGFTPRPWLSEPVFHGSSHRLVVSPGFTPRPWLSVYDSLEESSQIGRVSPGFTPRPWLSEAVRRGIFAISERVSGDRRPEKQ